MIQKVCMWTPDEHLAFILEMSYLKDGPSITRLIVSKESSQNSFKFLDISDHQKLHDVIDKSSQEMRSYLAEYHAFPSMAAPPSFQLLTHHMPTALGPNTHSHCWGAPSSVWATPENTLRSGQKSSAFSS